MFYEANTDKQFHEEQQKNVMMEMMNMLETNFQGIQGSNTNPAEEFEMINRPSSGQSANSSGFLLDALPGASSGLSFSSLNVSSENADESVILKNNEENGKCSC